MKTREELLDMMRHALGASHRGTVPGWRNRYCASLGSDEDAGWQQLVAEGLAVVGPSINGGSMGLYGVSEAGIAYVREHSRLVRQRPFTATLDGVEWTQYAVSAGKARMDIIRGMEWLDAEGVRRTLKALRVRVVRGGEYREVWP